MDVTFEGKSSTGKNEWLTPPHILRRLGPFDLDPCAPINRPWETAEHHYTIEDDGLKQPWFGRVFCNPPYDTALITQFIKRCAEHKNAIALTFARTDTRLFHELIFPNADSILFIPWFGRVFCNPPYDTALITQFIKRCAVHKNAIALTFARTDTRLFHELIFPNADSILFIKGRLSFYHASGEQGGAAGAPSCLIAFDAANTEVLKNCGIEGKLIIL